MIDVTQCPKSRFSIFINGFSSKREYSQNHMDQTGFVRSFWRKQGIAAPGRRARMLRPGRALRHTQRVHFDNGMSKLSIVQCLPGCLRSIRASFATVLSHPPVLSCVDQSGYLSYNAPFCDQLALYNCCQSTFCDWSEPKAFPCACLPRFATSFAQQFLSQERDHPCLLALLRPDRL